MRSEPHQHDMRRRTKRSAWRANVRVAALMAVAGVAACTDESVVDPPAAYVASDSEPNAMAAAQASDRDILVALYEATDGPNWTSSDNWLTDAPLGEWHGVRVNASGRVVALRLVENKLSGAIPAALGSLAALETLSFFINQLSGPIPPELANLAQLRTLWLAGNDLSAAIPPELGRLTHVFQMSVARNQLSAPLP